MAAVSALQPAEVEAWLHGLVPLLPREAVRALAGEVRRQAIDGEGFAALVSSRGTPPKLGDAVRPRHMATLRRCWNARYPNTVSCDQESRKSSLYSVYTDGGASQTPSLPVRAAPADRATSNPLGGPGATEPDSPARTPDPTDRPPYRPPREAWGAPEEAPPSEVGSRRPPQVPKLNLGSLSGAQGRGGEVALLAEHKWSLPAQPSRPGFRGAAQEDQRKIAEFYGYRDDGFTATMMNLRTDQIRPRIYVGNMADAGYWPFLRSLSITHVLNCAVEAQKAPSPYEASGIKYLRIPMHDTTQYAQDLAKHRFRALREGTRFVSAAVKAKVDPGNVLVHCVQGLSRGAAVVCAYLMEYESFTMDRALAEVRGKHPGCLSAAHWVSLLHKYNAELLRGG